MTNPVLFVVAAVVGAFAFSALGMLVSAAVKDLPTANMSLTALRLPMIFISGVFIPIRSLPFQLRVVSYLTPLTYLVDALHEAMMAPSIMFAVDITALLTWIAGLQALAIAVLKRRTQV